MNETSSTETHEQTVNEETRTSRPASAIEELVATGIGWAQYGLAMGRQTLQASAKTLDSAATFLGEISERLTKRPEDPTKQ
jgi:vacuolar-type H+-ATPase catalytic subunit A/Vma1